MEKELEIKEVIDRIVRYRIMMRRAEEKIIDDMTKLDELTKGFKNVDVIHESSLLTPVELIFITSKITDYNKQGDGSCFMLSTKDFFDVDSRFDVYPDCYLYNKDGEEYVDKNKEDFVGKMLSLETNIMYENITLDEARKQIKEFIKIKLENDQNISEKLSEK